MLGEALRNQRAKVGLTQQELAGRCGLTREYVSQIELDKRIPTLPVFIKLCRSLEMTTRAVVEMLDAVDWPEPQVSTKPTKTSAVHKKLRQA